MALPYNLLLDPKVHYPDIKNFRKKLTKIRSKFSFVGQKHGKIGRIFSTTQINFSHIILIFFFESLEDEFKNSEISHLMLLFTNTEHSKTSTTIFGNSTHILTLS